MEASTTVSRGVSDAFLAALPVPAFGVDAQGRVLFWTDAAATLTGRTAADVVGKKAWAGLYEKRRRTAVDDVLGSAEPVDQEIALDGATGATSVRLLATPVGQDPDALEGAAVALLPPAGNDRSDGLVAELDRVLAAFAKGQGDVRLDPSRFEGCARDVADRVSALVDAVRQRTVWYEAMLDAIPFPLSVTDMDMNWTFINRPTEQFLGLKRRDVAGKACNNWNANICRTEKCGVEGLRNGKPETRFQQMGGHFQVNTSYLLDANGQRIGHIEVVQDVTKYSRDAEYRATCLQHVAGNLVKLAEGDLTLDLTIPPADEHTRAARDEIAPTYESLGRVCDALRLLTHDADMLATAGIEGRLGTRADASRHNGEYRKVVEGVNGTLDAITGPMHAVADFLGKISRGEALSRTNDDFRGDFALVQTNMNGCVATLDGLLGQLQRLGDAAVAGELQTRADASAFQGRWREIVVGTNAILDSVLAPVNEAADALAQLSERDLRARVEGEFRGDHARIKNAVNATAMALQEALGQVADAVDQFSAASEQIAATSQSVSQGASEQAASLEETSSSLEEMAGMTKQNADNTQQAKAIAEVTHAAADKGHVAMKKMNEAMSKIRMSAEGTAEIIRDINEIAFQTNLLALNAAVEAARAGDAGRGFAVVAEEVRNLAQRSKEAAKKTEELIKQSVRLAESGEVMSREVSGNLGEIVESVRKVTGIVSEIAAASQEQARGIEQINKAVTQMDQVTQQSAANAEESSSASEELASQAQVLAEMVGRFELGRRETQRAPAAVRPAPTLRRPAPPSRPAPRPTRATNESLLPLDADDGFAAF